MFRRFFQRTSAVFALVFAWKIVLLVGFTLPIPSNDSFFYDGPVVNYLQHGKYANPALALALPISGTEVFCAYPPLYQAALLGWMGLCGTSVVAAMAFHLVLFGVFMMILLAILRRLALPLWTIHVAGGFLLLITFHDRPDSLAHVFGIAAVYCWIRSQAVLTRDNAAPNARKDGGWGWAMAAFVVLSLCTGLQIGAVYFLFVWIGTVGAWLFVRQSFPIGPMLALVLVPAALVALVVLAFPHLWAGFLEHARQTPSLTGWRVPKVTEVLKMIRTVPGVLAVAACLPWFFARRAEARQRGCEQLWLVTLTGVLAAVAMVGASMVLLTPNAVMFAGYLQPLIVGGGLALIAALCSGAGCRRKALWLFMALLLLGSIRAVGLSTWGVACAADVSCAAARSRVRSELGRCPAGSAVVLSSAFLYDAAHDNRVRWIHSDWMAPAQKDQLGLDWAGLLALKPQKIVLTQFDYFRRYQLLLNRLESHPELASFRVVNTARIPAPDSFRRLQRIVQHISWAPVIVSLEWK